MPSTLQLTALIKIQPFQMKNDASLKNVGFVLHHADPSDIDQNHKRKRKLFLMILAL